MTRGIRKPTRQTKVYTDKVLKIYSTWKPRPKTVLKVLVPSLSTLGSLGRHFCAQLGMALPAEAIRAAPSMRWGRPQMAEVIGHVLCSQRSLLPSPGTVLHKINWHTGRFFFCLNSKPSGLALPSFLTATFVCVYRTVVHCLRRTPSRLDVTMTTSA